MKISVITVSYHAERTIEDTLRSVCLQDYPNIDYIVVDGGSKDNTLEIIGRYKDRITTLVSEPDRGIYDAMNKGIALAKGDVIGFLNADDIYAHPRVLTNIAEAFASHPAAQCCYGDLVYVSQSDTSKIVRYWRSGHYKPGSFATGWVPPHPTFYARREAFSQAGLFNLDMRLAADFELMLRFMEKYRFPVHYIPNVMVRMRLGGATNQSIGNMVTQNKEILACFTQNAMPAPAWLPYLCVKSLRRLVQFVDRPAS